MTVAVDASALIAITGAEPDAGGFIDVLGAWSAALISTATLLEAHCVACRSSGVISAADRHRAALNMGDCFAYALAKTRNPPLLFKGDDFIHTDIESALGMA